MKEVVSVLWLRLRGKMREERDLVEGGGAEEGCRGLLWLSSLQAHFRRDGVEVM